jgi:hypothetical protein
VGELDRTHDALELTWVFKAPAVQHLNDSAKGRADVVLHSIIAFLGSSTDVPDRGLLGASQLV